MKFKTTAIALAVAGITAAPMVAQADGAGAYASIRGGLVQNDDGTDSSVDFASRGSRIGFKGETDLGNGMTGYGKYEWGVNSASSGTALTGTRHGIVGLKGDFGNILLGQTYHTYYNHVNSPVDIANWNSGFYSVGRTGEAVTYAGDFGAVSLGATGYFRNDHATYDSDLNGTEVALSFDAGPVRIGAGVKSDSEADGLAAIEDRTGVSVSGTFGDVYLGVSMQSQDPVDMLEVAASFGQFYAVLGQGDDSDADVKETSMTLGYSLPIGRQTNAWFEYTDYDSGISGSDKESSIEAILKYNWN